MEIISIDKLYRNTSTFHQINHYTSPEALLSIISNRRLRFTDCAFLNDIDEFNYIKKVLAKCFLRGEDKDLRESIEKLILNEFKENNEGYLLLPENGKLRFKNGKYYILSGSKNSDELPMWVYYSKSGGYRGYCINIDIDKLINDVNELNGVLIYGKVEYDLDKQINILEDNIRKFKAEYDEKVAPFKDSNNDEDIRYVDSCIDEYQEALFELVERMRLFFKNSDFIHEKEYRVALLVASDDKTIEKSHFVKNGILVPCVSVSLKNNLTIKSIVVGPTIDYNLSKVGLRDFLKTYDVINADNETKLPIIKSKVNVRY